MITDPSIRDQAYQYFLEEAPELLETIEQELYAINDGSIELSERPLRVNKLMRATHTLKGGAANVGLETIKTVAHSMEDVFKALYNPELEIDRETQKLLYASYDCLRIPLTAEFSQTPIDRDEILDRAAVIFAQLQEIFGDYLQGQDAFPTSEELGLDVVESFFESVVPERIQELVTVLATKDNDKIAEVLRSQADIFLGLAESLNLPGLGEIAQTIITALDLHPDLATEITQAAIANFKQAQQQVANGDRERGGEPSVELQEFTGAIEATSESSTTVESIAQKSEENSEAIDWNESFFETEESESDETDAESLFATPIKELETRESDPTNPTSDDEAEARENSYLDFPEEVFAEAETGNFNFGAEDDSENSSELMTEIWGEEAVSDLPITNISNQNHQPEVEDKSQDGQDNNDEIQAEYITVETVKPAIASPTEISSREVRKSQFSSTVKQKKAATKSKPAVNQTVRVNLDSLERLNDLIGELLINQNKNVLKDEQIYSLVQQLQEKIDYNEQIVNELLNIAEEVSLAPQQQQILQELPIKLQQISPNTISNYTQKTCLTSEQDTPEAKINQLLQLALTSNSDLATIADKIKNYNNQAKRSTHKQQKMLLNMRDELIETRMSPIGRLFNRFPRLLQQLSLTHDKQAELNIVGSHILIDKTIEEKLYDPLLHLVRNSFDHGLEFPDERDRLGKPTTGTVFLKAYYQGSQTIIEVGDDGQGINIEKIKQRGIEKNLLTSEQAHRLSKSQLLELLFEPGFSTADKVSDLSGRGVGLDVVRSQIEEMNGTISIESVPGQGTTFALKIPLTLTIAKLMLTEAAGMTYALLIDAIARIILPTSNQVQMFDGQKVLHWQTENEVELIPVRRLSQLIEYPRTISKMTTTLESSLNNPILLLHRSEGLIGLEVDKIAGEQELVIRPLGSTIIPPRYIYGCSVLKDSSLTLVIDGVALLKDAQYRHNSVSQRAFLADFSQVSLPSLPSSSEPPQQLPPATATSSIPKTLLVVDDSSSLRKTIAMSLEKVCPSVIQADNGINALTELKKSGQVELVVCDLEMPLMNGFQFLKALRQNPEHDHIPVIILTSRDSDKHRQLALELGASDYLVKPCPEQELLATINHIMRKTSSK